MAQGENDRAQHGADEFLDPAQPGDLLPAVQAELFDGVHLPARMHLRGGRRVGGRFAAGRRGWLALALEPALERAGAGPLLLLGIQVAQLQQQVGGTPLGMLLVQQECLLHERAGRGGRRWVVGGFNSGGAAGAEALTQGADGARGQAQRAGDRRRTPLALQVLPDAAAQGPRERSRHNHLRSWRRGHHCPPLEK